MSSHSAAMIFLHGEVSKLFSNANNFFFNLKFFNSLVMKCYRNLGFQIVDWILNSLKFDNIEIIEATWMDLEIAILNEVNQIQKDKHMI